MQNRRWFRLLALLLGLALVAAACGDDDDETSAGGDTSSTTEADDGEGDGDEGEGEGDGDVADASVSLDDRCEEAKAAGVTAPDDFTVRLITDIGKVDDRTFNQFAYEGMIAAADCFGFETSFIETASEADYEKNISTALEGDPAIVITVGFLLTDDTGAAAAEHPDTSFKGDVERRLAML